MAQQLLKGTRKGESLLTHNHCENWGDESPNQREGLPPGYPKAADPGKGHSWRPWFFGVVPLLMGAFLLSAEKEARNFSWDTLLGRPAATVNGEPITRAKVKERLHVNRLLLEKEHGKGLFSGDQGSVRLARLERNIIEEMAEELLVAREAKRLEIRVNDERVRREIEKISLEIYGSWDVFQESLKEDDISREYIMDHVRNALLRQEVEKAKFLPDADRDRHFSDWLAADRQRAKVILFQESVGRSEPLFADGPTNRSQPSAVNPARPVSALESHQVHNEPGGGK